MNVDELRALARRWCEYAVDGGNGRTASDPVYQAVTEGRDQGPRYSSCADLAHWLLRRLGVRNAYVNRSESPQGWKAAVNVSRLVRKPIGTCMPAREPTKEERFRTGDVLVVWSRPDTRDAHVLVVNEHSATTLTSWDYGQGPMSAEAWKHADHIEGMRRTRAMRWKGGKYVLEDGRTVQSVLTLTDALEYAEKTTELVEPDEPPGELMV